MTFTAACIQINSTADQAANIARATAMLREAAGRGANFALLPENVFLMAESREQLFAHAESEAQHPGIRAVRTLAAELGIWVLIGGVAVRADEEGKLNNRSLLIDSQGGIAAAYNKIHLFDVSIPGGETHSESSRFAPGDAAVTAGTPWGKLGMTVCYDLRFPHLYRALAQAGAVLLSVPAAFTYVTGQAHWHTLLRARAIENAAFVFAPAQCGTHSTGRRTYGHAIIIDPWGSMLAEASESGEEIITTQIDLEKVSKIRMSLPSLAHDRKFRVPAS